MIGCGTPSSLPEISRTSVACAQKLQGKGKNKPTHGCPEDRREGRKKNLTVKTKEENQETLTQ